MKNQFLVCRQRRERVCWHVKNAELKKLFHDESKAKRPNAEQPVEKGSKKSR